LHGLFGPKFALGHSNFHPFIAIKGGFLNPRFDAAPANVGSFIISVQNLRDQSVMGTLHPGGGLEGSVGPIDSRFDAGDEVYFSHSIHNNFACGRRPVYSILTDSYGSSVAMGAGLAAS